MSKKILIRVGKKAKIKGANSYGFDKKKHIMHRVKSAMIIDDDLDLSQLLTSILESRGIHVFSANSLAEAESCLAYVKPSVIFLDNSFPEGLGVNFIDKIKNGHELCTIIMITAEESEWIQKKAKEEGIHHFLKKPFSKKAIDALVDNLEKQV